MTKRFTTASLRSLAVKLPLLTLLWVSFIVSSIGYTMLLNWELEASAAAKFAVGELRNNIYRTALVAQPATSGAVFERRSARDGAAPSADRSGERLAAALPSQRRIRPEELRADQLRLAHRDAPEASRSA